MDSNKPVLLPAERDVNRQTCIILAIFGSILCILILVLGLLIRLLVQEIYPSTDGFDGWILWLRGSEKHTVLWNGPSDGGVINDALAPFNRLDPCKSDWWKPIIGKGDDLCFGT